MPVVQIEARDEAAYELREGGSDKEDVEGGGLTTRQHLVAMQRGEKDGNVVHEDGVHQYVEGQEPQLRVGLQDVRVRRQLVRTRDAQSQGTGSEEQEDARVRKEDDGGVRHLAAEPKALGR